MEPFCPKDSGRNRATDGEMFTDRHLANENAMERLLYEVKLFNLYQIFAPAGKTNLFYRSNK